VAKPLIFQFEGSQPAFSLTKIDRSKLYGYKETEVVDERGHPCELATLAGDGRTVLGKGGVALTYLSTDGAWCERSELKPVDLDGRPIQPVPSSYAAPVPLTQRATVEEYLDHNIRAIYELGAEQNAAEHDASALLAELRQGTIFKFPYSFRGGLEADAGFLLANGQGQVFLAVGNPTNLQFVGLQQAAGVVAEEEAAEEEEGEVMDFDMI
jgi:hypothetical protein